MFYEQEQKVIRIHKDTGTLLVVTYCLALILNVLQFFTKGQFSLFSLHGAIGLTTTFIVLATATRIAFIFSKKFRDWLSQFGKYTFAMKRKIFFCFPFSVSVCLLTFFIFPTADPDRIVLVKGKVSEQFVIFTPLWTDTVQTVYQRTPKPRSLQQIRKSFRVDTKPVAAQTGM